MRRMSRVGGITIAFASLCLWSAPASAQLTMTIVAPGGSAGLFSDGRGQVAADLYIDRTLPGGDVCAAGSVNNTGYTVFYPGLKNADGSFCNAGIDPSLRRTYTFGFPAGGVTGPCSVLGLSPTANLDGTYGPCTVTTDDVQYERAILSSLFAKKAKTTPVSLPLTVPGTTQMYSLQLDREATIVLDSNVNVRTAVSSGTARLYPVLSNGSTSSTAATASFSFPLQIRIQKSN